jgi:GNAT superfamily N-acetyltransferase
MALIRPACTADIPRLLALYEELSLVTTPREQGHCPAPANYERALALIHSIPGYSLLVVEKNGDVAGLMSLLIMPNLSHGNLPWALIESVVIDSQSRNFGLGTMLVKHSIEMARAAGCYKLVLDSNKKRLDAHRFCRSLGFEEYSVGFRMHF